MMSKDSDEGPLFVAELELQETKVKVEVPVKMPFEHSKVSEFIKLIMTTFDLPVFVEDELEKKFLQFIEDEYQKMAAKGLGISEQQLKENLEKLEKLYVEETLEFSKPEAVQDEEVFAEAYHSLVHSPILGSLLRKESALNSCVRDLQRRRNDQIQEITERQKREMKKLMDLLSHGTTENDVNKMAVRHTEESYLTRIKWESLLESEKEKGKCELRDWVMKTYQEYSLQSEECKEKGTKRKPCVRFDETLMISYRDEEQDEEDSEESPMQESFTIHLGSQLKQTYNIRVLASNLLDFLRFKNESSKETSPQRLQMAISLYSNDLSGIVILSDAECSINGGITKDLYELTQQTTDFHFDSLEKQLRKKSKSLQPGDVLITRHSNLNQAHVIFHLVCNQASLNRIDINSRHSVILGLRNIIKIACMHDITTLTIPALLCHSMAETMTPQWCSKRGELVYKCVKGFMIEMASLGGADVKNLQFITPKDVHEDVFASLSSMLPNIFRVSNPLRLSSSSSSSSLQHQLST